jgi:hypothetical protein
LTHFLAILCASGYPFGCERYRALREKLGAQEA